MRGGAAVSTNRVQHGVAGPATHELRYLSFGSVSGAVDGMVRVEFGCWHCRQCARCNWVGRGAMLMGAVEHVADALHKAAYLVLIIELWNAVLCLF